MWTEGDANGSPIAAALAQAKGRSVIVVMGNTPETCASVREGGPTGCRWGESRPGVQPCLSACLQFARSLVERGYPKVCCVQGGAQQLRALGLLVNIGKDP